MLVNSKKMLEKAKKNKTAIAQFNINNLEWAKYILEKTSELDVPIIIGVSEGAIKYMGGYNIVTALVFSLIHDLNIKNDVCLHLDHGSSYESCQKAIDAGFTSVMIDASKYTLEENIKTTKKVVEYAKNNDVTVEGEIGSIGGIEDNKTEQRIASYEDCIKYVEETRIDSLAPAVGSVHGIYTGKPNIHYDLIEKLNKTLKTPLVLHGGSGLNEDIIFKAIKSGISKININTELQVAWHKDVLEYIKNNKEIYDPRKIIQSGEKAIKDMITKKVNQFYK